MVSQRLSVAIIDPDPERRARFREGTIVVGDFDSVAQFGEFRFALEKLRSGTRFDVLFVSSTYPKDKVAEFVAEAHKTHWGGIAAYVELVPNDFSSTDVAKQILTGMDGMLVMPFSIDRLIEISKLAVEVRKEKSIRREKAAFTILAKDLIALVDRAATKVSAKEPIKQTMKNIADTAAPLRSLPPDSLNRFFDIAIDEFGSASPTFRPSRRPGYSGASTRVKKLMEEKLADPAPPSEEKDK